MNASTMNPHLFTLPPDVHNAALILSGRPVPQPEPRRVAVSRRGQALRAFGALALMAAAAYAGHQVTTISQEREFAAQMERIQQAQLDLDSRRRALEDLEKRVVPPIAQPAPPLPSVPPAIHEHAPVPTALATPPSVKAAEISKVPEAAKEKDAPKVTMVSIPAKELQEAIRRARAAGPKPAAKPAPIAKAEKPEAPVTSANWQELPIEFIPAERSIVATVTAGGLTLKNGGTVPIGGALSGTGERVLAVDPPNTIITNRRILSIIRN